MSDEPVNEASTSQAGTNESCPEVEKSATEQNLANTTSNPVEGPSNPVEEADSDEDALVLDERPQESPAPKLQPEPVPHTNSFKPSEPSPPAQGDEDKQEIIPEIEAEPASDVSQKEEIPLEDLEDGELSEGETTEITADKDNDQSEFNTTQDNSIGESIAEAAETKDPVTSSPVRGRKRSHSHSESSDGPKDDHKASTSSSSSDDELSKSERKKRKREKKKKKKEKKKKDKERKEKEREKKRRRRLRSNSYDEPSREGGYAAAPWHTRSSQDSSRGRSPTPQRAYNHEGYGDQYYANINELPGPYDSPPPDPYASPPYSDSEEDEFQQSLYNIVNDGFMDPNISAQESARGRRRGGNKMARRNKLQAKKERWMEKQRTRDEKRGAGRREARSRAEDKLLKCRFYQEGKCHKQNYEEPEEPNQQEADRCPYSHNFIPAKKMEACKFFLQGYCAKSDMCIYLHSEIPCKFYHTNQTCFGGDKCKFSHDPLTESTKPLLEKAIILEETGSFKMPSVRPAMLDQITFQPGQVSPPKPQNQQPPNLPNPPFNHQNNFNDSFSNERREDNFNDSFHNEPHQSDSGDCMMSPSHNNVEHNLDGLSSIFDVDVQPTGDMEDRLAAGLYDDLTAPLSCDEEDCVEEAEDSPQRPAPFYNDILSSPTKRSSRWDSKTPTQHDDKPKQPLLPLPQASTAAPTVQPNPVTSTSSVDEKAKAAIGLILNAFRSQQAASTAAASTGAASSVVSDPRSSVSDPRSAASANPRAALLSDPRKPLLQDPRAGSAPRVNDPRLAHSASNSPNNNHDPRSASDPRQPSLLPDPRTALDPRQAASQRPTIADPRQNPPIYPAKLDTPRAAPVLNGKPALPMTYNLKSFQVDLNLHYLPAKYNVNDDVTQIKDPRIRKRIQAIRTGPKPPPSLPDITADLQRLQNALKSNQLTAIDPRSRTKAESNDTSSNRPVSYLPERSSFKPQSIVKSSIPRLGSQIDSVDNDDEENSLTIDMSEDIKTTAAT